METAVDEPLPNTACRDPTNPKLRDPPWPWRRSRTSRCLCLNWNQCREPLAPGWPTGPSPQADESGLRIGRDGRKQHQTAPGPQGRSDGASTGSPYAPAHGESFFGTPRKPWCTSRNFPRRATTLKSCRRGTRCPRARLAKGIPTRRHIPGASRRWLGAASNRHGYCVAVRGLQW